MGYYEYGTQFSAQDAKTVNDGEGIRVTDVTLGLKQDPVGFCTVVHHSGSQWRTENESPSVNGDVVEWSGQIPV